MVIDRMMVGGAEQVFEDIVILIKNKVTLTALFISRSEYKQLERIKQHVPVIELKRGFKFSLLKMLYCARILKQFDIIHVHMRHTYRYISFVNKIFRINKKIILHDHYGSIEINQSQPFPFAKYLAPFYYIGVSDKLKDWAVKIFKMDTNRCSTLINLPRAIQIDESISNLTNSPQKELVIVGNIKFVKNQRFAIEFAKKIDQKIDIIGKIQDVNYYLSLDTLNANFKHDIDDVTKILKDYKFGMCTSISESGPLVLLEYLFSGLPFLSVRSGGISDILAKYLPQYFLDGFELNEWIDRYELLNDNYSRIDSDFINFIISKEFSRDKYMSNLLTIYKLCEK